MDWIRLDPVAQTDLPPIKWSDAVGTHQGMVVRLKFRVEVCGSRGFLQEFAATRCQLKTEITQLHTSLDKVWGVHTSTLNSNKSPQPPPPRAEWSPKPVGAADRRPFAAGALEGFVSLSLNPWVGATDLLVAPVKPS